MTIRCNQINKWTKLISLNVVPLQIVLRLIVFKVIKYTISTEPGQRKTMLKVVVYTCKLQHLVKLLWPTIHINSVQ